MRQSGMSAQRQLRILAHRDQASERTSSKARSRSAELARDPAPAKLMMQQHVQSPPKRPRSLAPMQRPGLNLQREAQEFEHMREQTELSQVYTHTSHTPHKKWVLLYIKLYVSLTNSYKTYSSHNHGNTLTYS